MKQEKDISKHNKNAPYWAVAFALFTLAGLSTTWFVIGGFWNGYVLDMVGPAWNYILFRGLFTGKVNNAWTRFFTANRTVIIFISVSFGIEALQFFEVYDACFDPFDLLAYISLLAPLYLIDKRVQ